MTPEQVKELCRFWRIEYDEKAMNDPEQRSVSHQIIGTYYKDTGELHPWGITPSSEDKGYSSY